MDLTTAGQQAGGFLGGVLNPLIGGKTETTVTTKPSASSTTSTVVVIVVIVVVVGIIGYFTFKKSS